jgi:hypothetical protein
MLGSTQSSSKISIQYDRQAPWLPWCRIMMIGDDQTGLTLDEIKRVLVDVPDHGISLAEIAFDFHPDTGVNQHFVLCHARFGKSQRREDRGGANLRFGSRRSAKLVRCYQKKEIGRFRCELELHHLLLGQFAIRNIADLPSVASKLCPAHIAFKVMRWEKLKVHLLRRYGAKRGGRFYEEARERAETSLHRLMRFLSGIVHNPHRFLGSSKANRHIHAALQRWAARFGCDEEICRARNDRGEPTGRLKAKRRVTTGGATK